MESDDTSFEIFVIILRVCTINPKNIQNKMERLDAGHIILFKKCIGQQETSKIGTYAT